MRGEGGAVGERLDRRLVAVMFTDMVGYTALMQADEGAALDKRKRYWRARGTSRRLWRDGRAAAR